jgi:hypothetical protein
MSVEFFLNGSQTISRSFYGILQILPLDLGGLTPEQSAQASQLLFECNTQTGWISFRLSNNDSPARRFCWVPPVYRQEGVFASWGKKVALGPFSGSGGVTILDFSSHPCILEYGHSPASF